MLYAQVVLPLAQPMYTFSLDEGLAVGVGDAVVVQFGSSRFYTGIVWSITDKKPDYPRLKPILKRLYTTPLVSPAAQRLWEWTAEYYMSTLGEVMRMALPSLAKPSATSVVELDERSIEPPMECYVALSEELCSEEALAEYAEKHRRRAPKRVELLDCVAESIRLYGAEDGYLPRRMLNISSEQLLTLRKQGVVRVESRLVERRSGGESFLIPALSEAQSASLEAIHQAHNDDKVALLHGVTGSGKTEIYMHLIADALSRGESVLMLVPEIVVTSQLVERLERIFEGRVTTYHSRLTPLRRGKTYLRLASAGGGELVVGVRSSIFLPLNNLGLVVVDEEHDANYKQSDMAPRYNSRDMAVVMGRMYGAKVVLGSATPSLESYLNAMAGKYAYVELKERWGEGVLPEVVISDTIRSVKRGERKTHINFDLLRDVERTLSAGDQAILFQNRRGYAPYIQCKTCGYSPRCPHCNVTLTQHKATARMECHYCGYNIPTPTVCPNCEIQDMALMGFGTEKAVEEISRLFPKARVERLDSDTSTSESAFKRIVSTFQNREADILVGTQIVTKGFDFGGVATVGILNADNLLSAPDFRATERAFQLMMQVAGRAGRRNDRGRVIIQTSQPKHPVIQYVASGDYHGMARAELSERKNFGYPPYSHLIRLQLRSENYELLRRASHFVAGLMRQKFGGRVMGPVSSALEILRGEHRSEILLKIELGASMQRARALLSDVIKQMTGSKEYKGVKLVVDVDAW